MHHQDGTAQLEWMTPSSLQYEDSTHLPRAMTCLITGFPGEPSRGTTPEVFDSIDELVTRTDGLFGTKVGLSKDFRDGQGREFVWTTKTDDGGVSTTYLGKHYKTGESGFPQRLSRDAQLTCSSTGIPTLSIYPRVNGVQMRATFDNAAHAKELLGGGAFLMTTGQSEKLLMVGRQTEAGVVDCGTVLLSRGIRTLPGTQVQQMIDEQERSLRLNPDYPKSRSSLVIRKRWSTLFAEWGAEVQVDVMPDETASHLGGGAGHSVEAE